MAKFLNTDTANDYNAELPLVGCGARSRWIARQAIGTSRMKPPGRMRATNNRRAVRKDFIATIVEQRPAK